MFFNNLVSEDERFYINHLTSVTINGKELVRYDYDPPRIGRRRFTSHSSEAGGKGASNPLAKRMFRKHKKDARSGKCVETDILSQVANKFNLKTEAL